MKRQRSQQDGRLIDLLSKRFDKDVALTRRLACRNRGLWSMTSTDKRDAERSKAILIRLFYAIRTKYPATEATHA